MRYKTAKEFKMTTVCDEQPWNKVTDVTHEIRERIGPMYYTTRAFSGLGAANLGTTISNELRKQR